MLYFYLYTLIGLLLLGGGLAGLALWFIGRREPATQAAAPIDRE